MLRENIAKALSHAVPSLGAHPSRFANALARNSDRWKNSATVYVRPVRPHVKGFLLWEGDRRPNSSLLMNSAMDTESGGSKRVAAVRVSV